jgi:ribosomal protein L37AE/L43A
MAQWQRSLTGAYETRYTKEGKMVVKDRSAKKKNEIHCQRCNGPMAFEKFYGENDSFFGWHCLMCGDILDPVILLHRLSQDASVAIPEKEKETMALIKKYMGARSKAI